MFQNMAIWLRIVLSFAVALIVSHFMTPPVKTFAERVGAIDVPRDGRRVHDHPIPRMGGLAIFIGFVVAMILFVSFTTQVLGLLLGALIIAGLVEVEKVRDGDAEGFGNEAERGGMRGAKAALDFRRTLGEGKE